MKNLVFAGLSLLLAAGCNAVPDAEAATTTTTSAELRTLPSLPSGAWQRLIGTWESASGPIQTIVFEGAPEGAGHRFFARSAATRSEGDYRVATLGSVSLQPKGGSAAAYTYSFPSDDTLVLSGEGTTLTFKRIAGYCDRPMDCEDEGLAHVSCSGRFICSPGHACGWICG